MKKEDVNKEYSRTWTRINDDSKSEKWRRVFKEKFGGEFVKRIKVWEWIEDSPEPEIKIVKPKTKTWIATRPDGTEDEITNLSKYCKEHKLDDGAVYRVLNGKRNHHKGYKIRRKGD